MDDVVGMEARNGGKMVGSTGEPSTNQSSSLGSTLAEKPITKGQRLRTAANNPSSEGPLSPSTLC